TRLQPLPKYFPVHEDMVHQPSMADAIKAGFDVSFKDPIGTVGTLKDLVTLVQGIRTAPLQPKAIGVAVGLGFRDGIEAEQVEGLHGSVGHRGNAERSPFAVALGNVHPAERLRPIAVPAQGAEGSRLGLRRVPDRPVHARSPRTRIADYSQDGQSPTSKRVSEQINQSLDLMPSALPNRLHDTRLEPTNRAVDLLPVDGMPADHRVRGRTSKRCRL